jgi:hypothetical protein
MVGAASPGGEAGDCAICKHNYLSVKNKHKLLGDGDKKYKNKMDMSELITEKRNGNNDFLNMPVD